MYSAKTWKTGRRPGGGVEVLLQRAGADCCTTDAIEGIMNGSGGPSQPPSNGPQEAMLAEAQPHSTRSRLPPPGRQVATGGQSVRVVRAEHPQAVSQQLLKRGGCARRISRPPRQRARLWRAARGSLAHPPIPDSTPTRAVALEHVRSAPPPHPRPVPRKGGRRSTAPRTRRRTAAPPPRPAAPPARVHGPRKPGRGRG
jgi:hypothetical protein